MLDSFVVFLRASDGPSSDCSPFMLILLYLQVEGFVLIEVLSLRIISCQV
jgi:hypothetical protein